MADNTTIQSGTLASVPAGVIVELRDQGGGVERQVVSNTTIVYPSASFTRPADTNTYGIGDLVANSTTAASVVPLSLAVANGSAVTQSKATVSIRRVKIKKSSTTTAVSLFRAHIFQGNPSASSGIINGDNSAYSVNDASAVYLGSMDVLSMEALADSAIGFGTPNVGSEINVVPTSGNVFVLLEARAAYVPTSGETFTVYLECMQW